MRMLWEWAEGSRVASRAQAESVGMRMVRWERWLWRSGWLEDGGKEEELRDEVLELAVGGESAGGRLACGLCCG